MVFTSYHSYPHFDGSLREWSNDIGDFVYYRHSEAAVQGVYDKKVVFEGVLENYKYDDLTFPKKHIIITESNIPRVSVNDYLGSDDAQVNFLMKTMLLAQRESLRQFHIYQQAEDKDVGDYGDSFDAMGLFENLEGVAPYGHQVLDAGIAAATTTLLTKGLTYDAALTESLQLPDHIAGVAFSQGALQLTTLWAKTETDLSESAEASYTFPTAFEGTVSNRAEWDYSASDEIVEQALSNSVSLSGRPSFFMNDALLATAVQDASPAFVDIHGNPGQEPIVSWSLPERGRLTIVDLQGRILIQKSVAAVGEFRFDQLNKNAETQLAIVQLAYANEVLTQKVIRIMNQ